MVAKQAGEHITSHIIGDHKSKKMGGINNGRHMLVILQKTFSGKKEHL